MQVVEVQITEWYKNYYFTLNGINLQKNDYVIVETEVALEVGKVVGFTDIEESEEVNPVIRKANSLDFEKIPDFHTRKRAMDFCRKMIDHRELPMKLVDVHFTLDGSRITFAFISDGRVDFRNLLKDLTDHFNTTIRLHQIGIRDEAKIQGDCGHCGRPLCCRQFISDFSSITSQMAEMQQVAHRGSDRISGVCGRLMCCLEYEQCEYERLAQNLPEIGQKVNVDGKKGVVVGQHVLKQSVDVEFATENGNGEGKTITEVDINRNKKK